MKPISTNKAPFKLMLFACKILIVTVILFRIISCNIVNNASTKGEPLAFSSKKSIQNDTCKYSVLYIGEKEITASLKETHQLYYDTSNIPQFIKLKLEERFQESVSEQKMQFYNRFPDSYRKFHNTFYLANPNDSINEHRVFIKELPYRRLNYFAMNNNYCVLSITERFEQIYLLMEMECGTILYSYRSETIEFPAILDSIPNARDIRYIDSRISRYYGKYNE